MTKALRMAKAAAKAAEYHALQVQVRMAAAAGNKDEVMRLNVLLNRAFRAL